MTFWGDHKDDESVCLIFKTEKTFKWYVFISFSSIFLCKILINVHYIYRHLHVLNTTVHLYAWCNNSIHISLVPYDAIFFLHHSWQYSCYLRNRIWNQVLLLAYIFLDETLSVNQVLGTVIVICGIWIVSKKAKQWWVCSSCFNSRDVEGV